MTFWEKAHKEIQFVDIVMIVLTPVWSIIAGLNFLNIIDANLWIFHFAFGACWTLWAAGFHTRWKRTGLELERMAKEVWCCYRTDPHDRTSPHYRRGKD